MSYRIVFHKKAEEEYSYGFAWYESEKSGLGERFEDEIERILNQLLTNPEIYSICKGSYREAVANVFPYSVVYKVYKQKGLIYISAVYHTRRNPKYKYRK